MFEHLLNFHLQLLRLRPRITAEIQFLVHFPLGDLDNIHGMVADTLKIIHRVQEYGQLGGDFIRERLP